MISLYHNRSLVDFKVSVPFKVYERTALGSLRLLHGLLIASNGLLLYLFGWQRGVASPTQQRIGHDQLRVRQMTAGAGDMRSRG